jgi:DNA-binding NarL/FixJ family response regulator
VTGDAPLGEVRVVIADDHTVVRYGTRQILEQSELGIRVVGEAGTGPRRSSWHARCAPMSPSSM